MYFLGMVCFFVHDGWYRVDFWISGDFYRFLLAAGFLDMSYLAQD